MTVVMIWSKKVRYKGIIKVLSVFFDQSSTLEDKEEVMKSELGVDMPARFREKEVHMGGYSEYILNQGRQEGQKQGKREGCKEGTAMALFNLMKKMEMTIEQAMDVLSIPKYQRKEYRAMVKALEEKAAR